MPPTEELPMPNQEISRSAPLTDGEINRVLDQMADSFRRQLRLPILHLPSEEDLDYEDVTFPSLDGVPLEGWFIPAAGSDKIIIANHPMGFSRAGIPSHLEPWKSIWCGQKAPMDKRHLGALGRLLRVSTSSTPNAGVVRAAHELVGMSHSAIALTTRVSGDVPNTDGCGNNWRATHY